MTEILFLAHRAPWPPDRGDRIRSWHMLDALMRMAPVHVGALVDSEGDGALARDRLEPLAASLRLERRRGGRAGALARAVATGSPVSNMLFRSPALGRWVAQLLATRPITHIVAFSGQVAQFVPAGWRGRFVMDFVDVDSEKFAAYARADRPGPMRWVHRREARVLGAWETSVAARADASLFVSEAEAALFRSRPQVDGSRVIALENGIDLLHFHPKAEIAAIPSASGPSASGPSAPGPMAVFTGQMDYRPNVEAVTDFARTILPLLRQTVPDACFAIVGRAPSPDVRALAALPGVIVTGEVPDTRPWLAAAGAVVAPLAVARGVQNKLLEAMAMARPVVASPAAAQGIDAAPGEHLLVADGARAFAGAVAGLLTDSARGAAMGRAARARMEARYGWDATLTPLAGIMGL